MLKSFLTTILAANLLLSSGVYGWDLKKTYKGSTFFDGFSFFTDADLTHGHVDYIGRDEASSAGLIRNQGDKVFMRADNTTISPNGRKSVRIVSKETYSDATLVLLDLEHMPTGCGTWPAFWMVGPDWPSGGEIDIIENVNDETNNHVTLHTSEGCKMPKERNQTGKTLTDNCDINAPGQGNNAGCGVESDNSNSYGVGLNKVKGGVYATQMTEDGGVQVWFFPRDSIPSDIKQSNPDPNTWPKPIATFPFKSGYCSIDHFKKLQIVFNLTFCGDWAGNTYANTKCPSTCDDFVTNNPHAFTDAYWDINYLKIYQ